MKPFENLQELIDYAARDRYTMTDDEWEESKHPRGQPGNAGQFTKAVQTLSENIETILHGKEKDKEALKKKFFTMVENTPEEFKAAGLEGNNISVQYGKISRHKGKDEDHYFSADEWRQVCRNLSDPEKCIITRSEGRKDFNIYTKIGKSVMVGVEVKTPARDVKSNNLKTIFRRNPKETETVLYPKDLKNITPAQRSLLTGLNPSVYTADERHTVIIDLNPELVKSINLMLKGLLEK